MPTTDYTYFYSCYYTYQVLTVRRQADRRLPS